MGTRRRRRRKYTNYELTAMVEKAYASIEEARVLFQQELDGIYGILDEIDQLDEGTFQLLMEFKRLNDVK